MTIQLHVGFHTRCKIWSNDEKNRKTPNTKQMIGKPTTTTSSFQRPFSTFGQRTAHVLKHVSSFVFHTNNVDKKTKKTCTLKMYLHNKRDIWNITSLKDNGRKRLRALSGKGTARSKERRKKDKVTLKNNVFTLENQRWRKSRSICFSTN